MFCSLEFKIPELYFTWVKLEEVVGVGDKQETT